MKGRWAAGIVPRNFAWIMKDSLAVSERPGGYAPHHRRVRRQEEILWLSAQGFTRIVSLLPSNHNLHAYDELHMPAEHFPLPAHSDVRETLEALYPALLGWVRANERVLLHQEELGERVAGTVAGFLCWSGLLPEPPRATSVVEQLLKRQMGSAGRAIVALAVELEPPSQPAVAAGPPPIGTRAGDSPRTAGQGSPASGHADGAGSVASGAPGLEGAAPARVRKPRPSRAKSHLAAVAEVPAPDKAEGVSAPPAASRARPKGVAASASASAVGAEQAVAPDAAPKRGAKPR